MKPVTIEEVIDAIYDASVIVRIRKYGIAPPDGWVLVPASALENADIALRAHSISLMMLDRKDDAKEVLGYAEALYPAPKPEDV